MNAHSYALKPSINHERMKDSVKQRKARMTESLTPPKAANRLARVLDTFYEIHGGDRFPVDIDQLALGSADIFKWPDPVVKIFPANIPNFEGALSSNEDKTKWMITYNESLESQGRIRFTKAHELGHYVLHRHRQKEFLCNKDDMLEWSNGEDLEMQADEFASYLLMPLNDFKAQIDGDVNLDSLGHCADRYGVSLTAAILKWLSYTPEKAVLVMSNDGFINWASSSNAAFKSGAFFKTRTYTIPIPQASLAVNEAISTERQGAKVPSKVWFKHADTDYPLTEMKVYSEHYDSTLSLLILPKYADFWPPRK